MTISVQKSGVGGPEERERERRENQDPQKMMGGQDDKGEMRT